MGFRALLEFVDRRSAVTLWAVSLAVVVLLGLVDYVTGFEISFAFFYLVPVSLAAWSLGRAPGFAVSVASAATWIAANRLAGEQFSNQFIHYWNAVTRAGFFVVVTLLVAALRRLLEDERALARTDSLTGALNGRAFYDAAEAELARARRYGHPFALVYFDLDEFKAINDRLGHVAGDRVLQEVATTAQRAIRATDLVARLGGDEFAVLMVETDPATARTVVPRLQGALLEAMSRNRWPVTFSIGALLCQNPPRDVEEMIRQADGLMYSVKNSTKNGVTFSDFHPEPAREAGAAKIFR